MGLLLGEAPFLHQGPLGPVDVPLLGRAAAAAGKAPHPMAELDEQPHGEDGLLPAQGGGQLEDVRAAAQVQLVLGPHHQHQAGGGEVVKEPLRRPVGEVGAADDAAGPLPLEQAAHLVPGGAGETLGHPGALQQLPELADKFGVFKGHNDGVHKCLPPLALMWCRGRPAGRGYFLNRSPDTSQSPSWTPGSDTPPTPAACRPGSGRLHARPARP